MGIGGGEGLTEFEEGETVRSRLGLLDVSVEC